VTADPAAATGVGNDGARAKKRLLIGLFLLVILPISCFAGAYKGGYYHAMRGGMVEDSDRRAAIAFFEQAYAQNSNCFMVASDIAGNYAVLGEQELAILWLRRTAATSYAGTARQWAKGESDFDDIRHLPEFRAFLNGTLEPAAPPPPTESK
jgi:hypothetical protein